MMERFYVPDFATCFIYQIKFYPWRKRKKKGDKGNANGVVRSPFEIYVYVPAVRLLVDSFISMEIEFKN